MAKVRYGLIEAVHQKKIDKVRTRKKESLTEP
jgi:hypothetical protein